MLARKGRGKEAKLSYHGHVLTENGNGLEESAVRARCSCRASKFLEVRESCLSRSLKIGGAAVRGHGRAVVNGAHRSPSPSRFSAVTRLSHWDFQIKRRGDSLPPH